MGPRINPMRPRLIRRPPSRRTRGHPQQLPRSRAVHAAASEPAEHGVEQPWATTSAEALAQAIFSRDSLVFSPETISAFMLALQTRRFVILSGISGTGKTQLARVFAELVAQRLGTARNVAIVPVRPDWTDHRGLLGCENVISNKYALTDAVRLMLDASAELVRAAAERRKPAPFFLILDEMNLARVEHYLADVLSAMESRQALSLHDHDGATARGSAPPRSAAKPLPHRHSQRR
jgi:MoxR-like ATPase